MSEIYVPREYISEQLDKGSSVEFNFNADGYDYFTIYQNEFPQIYNVYTDEDNQMIFGVKY